MFTTQKHDTHNELVRLFAFRRFVPDESQVHVRTVNVILGY